MSSREPITISSVAQVHAFMGQAAPPHPHISVIGAAWHPPLRLTVPLADRKIHSDLYAVSLKRGDECWVAYGRQVHDAQAGTLLFLTPGQSFTPMAGESGAAITDSAWTLVFHPDLVAGSSLAPRLRDFGYFRYTATEALHLHEGERRTLTDIVQALEREASVAPDAHSKAVLVAHLELFFSYCQRFYARQFHSRAQVQGGVLARLQRHLDEYLSSARPSEEGLPTVALCAKSLGYSPDYLSDLLREETGGSARDHIHRALIEAAKRRLASTRESVGEVAHSLGFEQPQHFSKLFKQKTGSSPGAWRG
jgi:AraC family transcriptional activator of pobA